MSSNRPEKKVEATVIGSAAVDSSGEVMRTLQGVVDAKKIKEALEKGKTLLEEKANRVTQNNDDVKYKKAGVDVKVDPSTPRMGGR